ncbi:MAG: DUF4956 domain-containing protein [Anaerofustis sp.]
MGLQDILKKSVYDQYISSNSDITVELLLVTLLIVALLSVFMIAIYKLTYKGAIFSYEYAGSLILTALVTSLVILPISYNLTLSLGMVGALSIVRFRTAVKNSKDISYMFWAIAIGITCGAGFYLIAIAGTAFIALVMIGMMYLTNKRLNAEPCILVIRMIADAHVDAVKNHFPKIIVKSLTVNDQYTELTAEIPLIPDEGTIRALRENEEILNMSFVKYNGDYAV